MPVRTRDGARQIASQLRACEPVAVVAVDNGICTTTLFRRGLSAAPALR